MFCNYGTNIIIGDNHMQRFNDNNHTTIHDTHSFQSNSDDEEDYDY